MDFRTDCFYIYLMIYCFIFDRVSDPFPVSHTLQNSSMTRFGLLKGDESSKESIPYDHGKAASQDKHKKPIEKKCRKWTTDEEARLIYFDVITDTKEPNHFARIRDLWHKEYPETNVTDVALRDKLNRLRHESLEEGELKKNLKWNEALEQELLDVYQNTRPYKRAASSTMEEEWNRRHPDYQGTKGNLDKRVSNMIKGNKYPGYKLIGEEGEGRKSRKWTAEWNATLRSLDKLTNTGEPYQFERIKHKWFEEFPNSNVTDTALQVQLNKLRRKMTKKDKLKKYFKWTQESEKELLDLYFNTYPYKSNANITLEAEWARCHPYNKLTTTSLIRRAQRILRENKYSEYEAQESSTTNLQWDNQDARMLMHTYNVMLPGKGSYLKRARRMWSELHPQYSHVPIEQFKERVDNLRKNPPDATFPWTERENQELLEIYDETMPDKEDQGQRIYDIWSQRHPRYKFMTPYYLQVHASTLACKRKVEAIGKHARLKWTDEEKADLVDMVRRYPRDHRNELHTFHVEWVRKHPRLAHKTNSDLLLQAKRFMDRGIAPQSSERGEGSQTKLLSFKGQNHNKYTPMMKKKLLDMFHQTIPGNIGHADRLRKKWYEEHEDLAPIQANSLKRIARIWEEREPGKRADKAPMVYSSYEVGSPSSPRSSGDSE